MQILWQATYKMLHVNNCYLMVTITDKYYSVTIITSGLSISIMPGDEGTGWMDYGIKPLRI